jgi:hypothetical protein
MPDQTSFAWITATFAADVTYTDDEGQLVTIVTKVKASSHDLFPAVASEVVSTLAEQLAGGRDCTITFYDCSRKQRDDQVYEYTASA